MIAIVIIRRATPPQVLASRNHHHHHCHWERVVAEIGVVGRRTAMINDDDGDGNGDGAFNKVTRAQEFKLAGSMMSKWRTLK